MSLWVLEKSVYEVPWSLITDNGTDAFCPVHSETSWHGSDTYTYEVSSVDYTTGSKCITDLKKVM